MNMVICECGVVLDAPTWLSDLIGYGYICGGENGHAIMFNLEAYREAEAKMLEQML